MRRVDVLIVGGGMVGLPMALALAQGGLKTLVVDAAPPAKVLEPEFDGRVSALAYASVRMLQALGVWTRLEPHAQPMEQLLVMRAGDELRARLEVARAGAGRQRLAKRDVLAGKPLAPRLLRDDISIVYVFHGSIRTAMQ